MMKPLPQHCEACAGLTKPLNEEDISIYRESIPEWKVSEDGKSLSRTFICEDYDEAVAFIIAASIIAGDEGHHPDHNLTKYRRLTFSLTTHAAKGLTVNDFVMATLIDAQWNDRDD